MRERSDEELMEAVLGGDRLALTALVSRHHSLLLRYLYRLLGGDRSLAEDMVQDAFLRVMRQPTYQPGRPFKPWLYTIATNLARDHYKSAAVRRQLHGNDSHDGLHDVLVDGLSPEEHLISVETSSEVRIAVTQLGEKYRAVVVLRFYQGFSLREIAATLQVPVGTVKSRLSQGVRRLRSMLTIESIGRI